LHVSVWIWNKGAEPSMPSVKHRVQVGNLCEFSGCGQGDLSPDLASSPAEFKRPANLESESDPDFPPSTNERSCATICFQRQRGGSMLAMSEALFL